jgi:hypothetical protein
MAQVTWLGDEDPEAQVITMFGHEFVKGVPTSVPDKDPSMEKLKGNAFFSVGKGGDVVESHEPDPVDPDEGTERAAVKAELDRMNVKYDGRAKLETLREALAKAKA